MGLSKLLMRRLTVEGEKRGQWQLGLAEELIATAVSQSTSDAKPGRGEVDVAPTDFYFV
jgi:hypothetical protein